MSLAPFSSRQRYAGGRPAPMHRWDPRREIDDLSARFNQLVGTVMGESPLGPGAGIWSALAPVDIEETDEAYIVDLDLPNVNPQDVDIQMRGEELRITGAFQQRPRSGVMRRQLRETGEFEYQVDLPGNVDADRVEAVYTNGVLTITLAKLEESATRKIEVHTAEERPRKAGSQATHRSRRES
ncbi:Hsp20/alpha crystallin family protein [Dactylosporangium aurantiacum]|uniref:Hsp20/alpha crystallin family protein n=1 Tax=Dactylosporangium aurantiacum TaxID=35754 RepID=A0A9Q9IA22_9ACTN|nr:Hsp20/alpha crystallin family protein [Dactylosporangium aurantiacum]MDG6107318.1 Hsp20/alpha crystallin family protein [Dactylosporangium aurantiacum]UWZ51156.1 Hsp20/alpha crystallin family protein [Dactylosporangium aurantiacum]